MSIKMSEIKSGIATQMKNALDGLEVSINHVASVYKALSSIPSTYIYIYI
jgi:hypothetical protein